MRGPTAKRIGSPILSHAIRETIPDSGMLADLLGVIRSLPNTRADNRHIGTNSRHS
jgi:hypothetical protein